MSEPELAEQNLERAGTAQPEAALAAGEFSFTGPTRSAWTPPPVRALRSQAMGGLQRTIGNRGVQRLFASGGIQRVPGNAATTPGASAVPATPTEWAGGAIPADMVTAAPPAVPAMSGSTTAAVKGDLVTVTAPKAAMADVTFGVDSARYTIAEGKNIEGGFVQTVKRSERFATYEAPPAKPGADPMQFEQNLGTPGARRDVTQVRNAPGDKPFDAASAPFFLKTETITKTNPGGSVSGTAPGTGGFDQPSMTMETKIGTGKLVSVRGREDFQTSFAVKDKAAGPLTHLSKSAWGFLWDVPGLAALADGEKANGKGGKFGPSGEAPSVVDGPTAKESAVQYLAFTSVDAAMTQSAAVLFDNMAKADAAGDADTVAFSEAALRAKNPKFTLSLTCKTTDTYVGRDSVRFYVGKTKADVRTKLKARDASASISFNLLDVLDGTVSQAEAHIGVDLGGSNLETTWWKLRQSSFSESMKVGTGLYDVKGSMVP